LKCERIDQTAFTGDVIEHVRRRIDDARLVIADLSEARPNVYLEVGYAWGRNKPTILVARQSEKLHFDVQGQKCIFYNKIGQLRELLAGELAGLRLTP
jgi:nucleoside 2-deoxyribosyltransferase